MQLITLTTLFISAASALSFRSSGFAKVARNDPHIGDIRIFGELGCSADNQGVWTVLQSDLGVCQDFSTVVKSVILGDIKNGCTFFAFSEAGCQGVRRAFGVGGCDDAVDGVDTWGSFEFVCPTDASGN
ncbi:hypothetical protein QBC46DRAFT_449015 [Diplogelasinospora grovesii]|uniref:Uncharacterized protein n=1 Tax=Diplogelasinospora grovesii TaxID=303347 RepID=A0AAN6S5F7_9PEZI|nr:hypothetical protein QBC46DRAFT_449015 [Diplogelasinospora grovesii]